MHPHRPHPRRRQDNVGELGREHPVFIQHISYAPPSHRVKKSPLPLSSTPSGTPRLPSYPRQTTWGPWGRATPAAARPTRAAAAAGSKPLKCVSLSEYTIVWPGPGCGPPGRRPCASPGASLRSPLRGAAWRIATWRRAISATAPPPRPGRRAYGGFGGLASAAVGAAWRRGPARRRVAPGGACRATCGAARGLYRDSRAAACVECAACGAAASTRHAARTTGAARPKTSRRFRQNKHA